jgi:hypothetical protein
MIIINSPRQKVSGPKGYLHKVLCDVHKTVMCIECGTETDIKGSIEARGAKPSTATRDRIRKQWRERSHE